MFSANTFAVTFVLCTACQHLVAADVTADAWNRFYNAMATSIGGDPRGITFLKKQHSIGVDYPSTGLFEQYNLCNQAPSWNPAYNPVGNVYDGYKEMTDSLYFEANKAALDQAKKVEAEMELDRSQYNQCMTGLTAKWINFHRTQKSLPPANQMTYQDWMKQFGQPLCAPMLQTYQASYQQYQKYLEAATHSGYDYVMKAWAELADPDNYMTVFDGTNNRNVSICTFSPDFGTTLQKWQANAGTSGSFEVTSDTKSTSDYQLNVEGGGELWWDPIFFEGGGSYSKHTVDTASTKFSMTVGWDGMETFQMSRGDWYNGALIQGHKNGPWIQSSPIGKGVTKLWGDGGELGLIPTQAVVMYHMSLSITLDEQTYSYVKEHWTQESGACVFIFCVESTTSSTRIKTHFDDETFTFMVTDETDIPKLVAIVNQVNEPPSAASLFAAATDYLSLGDGTVAVAQPHDSEQCEYAEELAVGRVPCNSVSPFPNLSPAQFACVNALPGIKTFNTVGWTLLYISGSTRDEAHFAYARNTNGNAAHFTCRAQLGQGGRHVGADNQGTVNSWLRNGCCGGRGWPSNVATDMQKLIGKIGPCL